MQKPDLTTNDLAADFLQCPDRHDTGAEKWDRYQGRTTATGKEILPFWVADMDFQSPDVVLDAIRKRTDHAVFGYTHETPGFASTLTTHLREQHNWQIDPSWVIGVPGIVTGLSITARLLSQPGDGILTLTPVYQPFLFLPKLAERRSVRVPLHADVTAQRWTIDWELLEAALTPDVKIFWLCHPHNPTGKVFTREELLRIADLCEKHGVTVVSDEIWDDLILDGSNHIPFASLDHPVARRSITFVAASKTWNIAGLGCAAAIVPNKDLRHPWRQAGGGLVPMVNPLGYAASEAAWKDGDAWRQKLLNVLKYNKQLAVEAIHEISGISCIPPQATYLLWIDCNEWIARQPPDRNQPQHVCEEAGIGPSNGPEFGGSGYLRLNFGCPPALLQEGLERLRDAFGAYETSGQ
jgi:cystathionine beta-lyase